MVVREGMRITVSHVTVEIVEVIPYQTPSGGKHFLVAYRIHDHGYVSPVAHFWISETESSTEKLKDKLAEIVDYYKQLKTRGVLP